MQRADSLEKILMLQKLKARREGVTEDEIVGWHYQLNGYEFEQALGDGEGQPGMLQPLVLQRVRQS